MRLELVSIHPVPVFSHMAIIISMNIENYNRLGYIMQFGSIYGKRGRYMSIIDVTWALKISHTPTFRSYLLYNIIWASLLFNIFVVVIIRLLITSAHILQG